MPTRTVYAYATGAPIPVGSYAGPAREEPPAMSDHDETLPAETWTGVLAELGTDSTDLRRLTNPAGMLRTRPMPLPLHYARTIGGPRIEYAGQIDRVWIDGDVLYGLGRAWHPELAARLRDGEQVAVGIAVGDVEHALTGQPRQPARAAADTLTLSGHRIGTLSAQQQAASLAALTGLTEAEVPELGVTVARTWRLIDACAYGPGMVGAFPTARITCATLRRS